MKKADEQVCPEKTMKEARKGIDFGESNRSSDDL